MPGRTPPEAFENFCDPLKRALACIGAHAKITPSEGGRSNPKGTHAWSLNGMRGLSLGEYLLQAQMHYEFIPRDEGWRITTKAYRYKLSVRGKDLFRIHWHPWGNSPYKLPHIHAHFAGAKGDLTSLEHHLPTGRMTFEDAISWAILSGGIEPQREDWAEVLEECQSRHVEHRTWSDRPPLDD